MYIVIGKDNCSQCDIAKRLLEIKKEEYLYLHFGVDISEHELDTIEYNFSTVFRTFPIIFKYEVGKKFIKELLLTQTSDIRFIGSDNELKKDLLR